MQASEKSLDVPPTEAAVRELAVGDFVRLNGRLITARDAVHKYLARGAEPPCDLQGAVLYHCGPVTVRTQSGEWRVTAAGPTTSAREEPYMADLIRRFRLRGVIGKGGMGPATLAACAEVGCVYFHAVGGAARVLAKCIRHVPGVHLLDEFGAPEAMWLLDVENFPVMVTMDARNGSLHEQVARESADVLAGLLRASE